MELTIIQNGALYAMQHKPAPTFLQKGVRTDLIWSYRTLTTSMKRFSVLPIPAETAQSRPQNNGAQVADAFFDCRVAA
jgi:hypothetical protein